MAISNQDAWNSGYALQIYANADHLQKAEQTIVNILKTQLPAMRMLDIGVGTGRTTIHFAPLVKEYVGCDYAENMIKACARRFPEKAESFRLSDVRSMPEYETGSFDLVLFSYNGMDYISHEDRLRALKEIRRVLKPGGYFVFSTHNLHHFDRLYTLKWHKRWKDFIYQFYSLFMLIVLNGLPGKYMKRPFAVVNDGTNRFALKTYYMHPAAQKEQLEAGGFKNIRVFSSQTGMEIEIPRINEMANDHWVYYMCEI